MYLASVTLHVLAAIFWLGGMFFLGIVGAPALAGLDTDLRRRLFKDIGPHSLPQPPPDSSLRSS